MIRQSDGPVPVSTLSLVEAVRTPAAPGGNPPPVQGVPVVATTRAEVEEAVAQANQRMTSIAPSLQFEIDPDTQRVVIRLIDRQDDRVLRQVPSPEMLEIARALERMQALLVRTRA